MPHRDALSRRELLERAACGVLAAGAVRANADAARVQSKKGKSAMLQTVMGAIPAGKFGFALPHEHILCDFIGADKTSRARWNVEAVIAKIRPYLQQVSARGVTGFVDCTPAYIGRDPRILKQLAEATGLHILTNTGYYGAASDKFLPQHAFTETADQLAARWIGEWEQGIEGTGVKPGFIKIGVDPAEGNPPRLSEVDAKLVRAAARAHKRTGLTIASHTVQGLAALEQIKILESEGVSPAHFIYVHADGEPDQSLHFQAAEKGAWVEYDGISADSTERHRTLILPMLAKFPDHLLLSHDAGWVQAGEPDFKIRDYNAITDTLLPALRKAGVTEAQIHQLTVENPARAFALTSGRGA